MFFNEAAKSWSRDAAHVTHCFRALPRFAGLKCGPDQLPLKRWVCSLWNEHRSSVQLSAEITHQQCKQSSEPDTARRAWWTLFATEKRLHLAMTKVKIVTYLASHFISLVKMLSSGFLHTFRNWWELQRSFSKPTIDQHISNYKLKLRQIIH